MMQPLVPIFSTDLAAELKTLADALRTIADRLPIMSACRLRVHAEEIAAEAIRLQDKERA